MTLVCRCYFVCGKWSLVFNGPVETQEFLKLYVYIILKKKSLKKLKKSSNFKIKKKRKLFYVKKKLIVSLHYLWFMKDCSSVHVMWIFLDLLCSNIVYFNFCHFWIIFIYQIFYYLHEICKRVPHQIYLI